MTFQELTAAMKAHRDRCEHGDKCGAWLDYVTDCHMWLKCGPDGAAEPEAWFLTYWSEVAEAECGCCTCQDEETWFACAGGR